MRDIEPEPSNDSNLYEDELELWKKIRSGDEKAREEVIISYRPMVFWLASKLHVSPDSHQDLIQEGMVALIEAVDRYDFERGAKFITYAYYRVKGHMINFLERSEAKAPEPVDLDSYVYQRETISIDEREEWLIDLERAIESLTAKEAEVIRAIDLDGLSAKEVARKRGVDISYIYRLRRRAIAKLREILGVT